MSFTTLRFSLIFIVYFIHFQSFSQIFHNFSGARSDGMGNANVTLVDAFSGFNNIGALAWTDEKKVFTGYKNQFLLPELNTIYLGANFPNKYGTANVSLARFGGTLYNETLFGFGIGHRIGTASIGLKINYLQISAETLGTRQTWVGEMGGRMLLREDFAIGAHIYNFNQAKTTDFQNQKHPTIMKAGFSYFPNKNLIISFQVTKDIDFAPTIGAGIEYQIIPKLVLRTGMMTKPFFNTFGAGLKLWNFQFNYAFQSHSDLQSSNSFSVIYKPLKKK